MAFMELHRQENRAVFVWSFLAILSLVQSAPAYRPPQLEPYNSNNVLVSNPFPSLGGITMGSDGVLYVWDSPDYGIWNFTTSSVEWKPRPWSSIIYKLWAGSAAEGSILVPQTEHIYECTVPDFSCSIIATAVNFDWVEKAVRADGAIWYITWRSDGGHLYRDNTPISTPFTEYIDLLYDGTSSVLYAVDDNAEVYVFDITTNTTVGSPTLLCDFRANGFNSYDYDLGNGRIYGSGLISFGDYGIAACDASNGTWLGVVGNLPNDNSYPDSLAVDPSGDIDSTDMVYAYMQNRDFHQMHQWNPVNDTVNLLAEAYFTVERPVYDDVRGEFYAVSQDSNDNLLRQSVSDTNYSWQLIHTFDGLSIRPQVSITAPDQTAIFRASGITEVDLVASPAPIDLHVGLSAEFREGIIRDPLNGDYYGLHFDDETIYRFNSSFGQVEAVSISPEEFDNFDPWVAFDSMARRLLIGIRQPGVLSVSVDPFGSDPQVHWPGQSFDSALRFDYENQVLYGFQHSVLITTRIPSYNISDSSTNSPPLDTLSLPFSGVADLGVSPADARLYLALGDGTIAFLEYAANPPGNFTGCFTGFCPYNGTVDDDSDDDTSDDTADTGTGTASSTTDTAITTTTDDSSGGNSFGPVLYGGGAIIAVLLVAGLIVVRAANPSEAASQSPALVEQSPKNTTAAVETSPGKTAGLKGIKVPKSSS